MKQRFVVAPCSRTIINTNITWITFVMKIIIRDGYAVTVVKVFDKTFYVPNSTILILDYKTTTNTVRKRSKVGGKTVSNLPRLTVRTINMNIDRILIITITTKQVHHPSMTF